jgi:hypothetical protein
MSATIYRTLISLVTLLYFSTTISAQTSNTLLGKWQGADEPRRQLEIYLATDGFYYGKLIYDGGKTEHIGKLILKKMSYIASSNSFTGTMSPPDTKMEADATVSFISIDQIRVSVKKLLMSKTIYFIRTS